MALVSLPGIQEKYGYPHCVGHRSTLAGQIFDGCEQNKAIRFHFSHSVTAIKSFKPKAVIDIQPRNGETYTIEVDILLAADGIKSVIRPEILRELQYDADVVDTGQAAYRISLTREEMQHDPELLALIDKDAVTRWIGEKKHMIAYPVSSKTVYNIATAHPDVNFAEAPTATYTTKGSKDSMMSTFGDFCPLVHKMLDMVPDGEVCEWKLRVHHPLPTWVHGVAALVGDAAHPTLPHLNQGAAQAIEDAGVLSVALAKLPDTSSESINKALQVYERVRKRRAETLVDLAALSGKTLMLGEGEAKKERDKMFAAISKDQKGSVPDKWADAEVQAMIYGHDCMQVTEDTFDEIFNSL